jgi:hypothetical protein
MKQDPRIALLAKHSSNNEIEILHSKTCSCYFCRQTYSAREVNDWINDERGVTAICPVCGMDAVIGDACGIPLDKPLLKEMNLAYYGEDYMEKHPTAALKYVQRYKKGNITHKKVNEALYIQYLSLLAGLGNSTAAFDLAQLYENGSEFTEKDPKTAFSYYAMRCLSSDGGALTRLGVLSENGSLGKPDFRGAYECYAKAMAMGSLEALIRFSDCYMKGIFVQPNPLFAYDILTSIWPEIFSRFVSTSGKEITVFPDAAYRLGNLFLTGAAGTKDSRLALRYFLYAQFGFEIMKTSNLLTPELALDLDNTEKNIDDLAKKFHLTKQDPVFDNDSFADSLGDFDLASLASLEPNLFTPGTFDKGNHTFSFDVTYPLPPLLVDVGNLFCGFVPGTIHWDFIDVSEVTLGQGNSFSSVTGNPEDGWDFMSADDQDDRSIVSIVLMKSRAGHKHMKTGGGKA